MKRKVFALVLAGVMAASMTACGSKKEAPAAESAAAESATSESVVEVEQGEATPEEDAEEVTSEVEQIQEKGVLVVGVTDFEPMDYKDENGIWIGFDAELAAGFAEKLGVNIEIQEIDWDNKILELESGSIDCVWNGMTLTSEVLSSMECSDAYLNNAQVVVCKSDDADKYQDVESLKDLNFAVESGSAGEEMAIENGLNYTPVTNQAAALMEIASGTADAAIIDSLMAAAMVGEGTSYEDLTYTVSLNSEEYGVGFRKGSDLAGACNEYFAEITESGLIADIAEVYKVQAALVK